MIRLKYRPGCLVVVMSTLMLSGVSPHATYAARSSMAHDMPITPPAESLTSDNSAASAMEEGKMLFANGQYMPALGKFMNVLRQDPTNPEARSYLRKVIDALRQNPKNGKAKALTAAPDPMADEEMQRQLEKRARLTSDINAIPGLKIDVNENTTRVVINTSLLFADKTGGLREQGVPMLDRVAAWLKTFGQQPVVVHCYPEETQDPATNGSLFLHRYSELYNFFVDERGFPQQRFVSADLLSQDESKASDVGLSTSTPHVVIETVGSQAAFEDDLPANIPRHPKSSWVEFSIYSSQSTSFNPEEGEWASLDLAAMTRTGIATWRLTILPMTKAGPSTTPVYTLQGKNNVLLRMSWDGRDQKSGSFVSSGSYLARFVATDAEGTRKTQEMKLHVRHGKMAADETIPMPAHKTAVKRASRSRKASTSAAEERSTTNAQSHASVPASPTLPSSPVVPPAPALPPMPSASGTASDDDQSLIGNSNSAPGTQETTPAAAPPAPAVPPPDDTTDSTHAIWKQVVQFNTDSDSLATTQKASLERIGKTLDVYPLQKVRIVGFATSTESDATSLAKQRAQTVRDILVNEDHVDAKRVLMSDGKVSSDPSASKVELSITN